MSQESGWGLIGLASIAVVMVAIIGGLRYLPQAPASLIPTPRVENTIQGILTNHPNIVGVEISQIDLVKNRDYLVYARFTDHNLQSDFQDIIDSGASYSGPAFSEDHSESNRYMVRVLGGDFSCIPLAKSIELRYFVARPRGISAACSISVPPESSAIHGILTVFFKNPPQEYEKDLTRVIITDLAREMDQKR